VAVLEMTSQTPRDKVLWILTNYGPRMKPSELRRQSGIKMQVLLPVLKQLVKEGKIKTDDKDIILL
jgi:predicted transcriptional regulator